jgi:hypothetical protein
MKGKRLYVLILMLFFAIGAGTFLWLVGNDALAESHPFQFFADSNTYYKIYTGQFGEFDGVLIGVASNYLGPLAVLNVFQGNTYLIMIFNCIVFLVSVMKISKLMNISPLGFALILLISPLTISSLLSVNKEVFAFPFFAFALAGYMKRSTSYVVLALLCSLLVRWQLTAFYLVIIVLNSSPRICSRSLVILVLLALASAFYVIAKPWLEPVVKFVEASIENYDEAGSGLFEAMLDWQSQGYYIFVFPIKAAHLLFGMGLKFEKILNPENIYNDLLVSSHCLVALLLFVALVKCKGFNLRNDLVFASIVFLIVFCLSPVFAPRYLHPVYVIWGIVILRRTVNGKVDNSPLVCPRYARQLNYPPQSRTIKLDPVK